MTPAIDINDAESIGAALAQMNIAVPVEPPTGTVEEPESELTRKIQLFEITNKELMDGVPDIDINLPQIPANTSDEEKLEILEEINKKLVEIINAEDQKKEQEEQQQELKPKFGSGLAVPMDLKGKPDSVWVDENQIDVDTGEKYNFGPELKEIHKKKLEKRSEEKKAEDAAEFLAEYDKKKESHSHFAMTPEEYDRETDKEYPIYILPKQSGPKWDDSILYGDAGNVIRKATQYNEAHPAGMLLDFLVSLGSLIGRGPYFNINETRHYTNEFMARVGDSSKSRKGSGRDAIEGILKLVDPDWYSNRIESGFGSGEAIISRVRDSIVESKLNHKTQTFENTVVPGVNDVSVVRTPSCKRSCRSARLRHDQTRKESADEVAKADFRTGA